MKHLQQPRGPGTAYRFRIKTPKALVGMIDPKTGKQFGQFIFRDLGGTNHLPTARKLRDIRLAEVRAMEADAAAGDALSGRFGLERAEVWAEALRVEKAKGGPDEHAPSIMSLIEDEVERAEALPKSKRPAPAKLKAFAATATSRSLSLNKAVTRYLHDRRPGNGNGYAPMAAGTERDLKVAVRYLAKFMKAESGEALFLDDITPELALMFRGDFLPAEKSPRAPNGMSAGTIAKHVTLLRNLWLWAYSHHHLPEGPNPWDNPKGVRKAAKSKEPKRDMYSPDEATAIMKALPRGHHLGDVFRLSLVTGCRADELAKVRLGDVAEDASHFVIREGKTVNAQRTIPVPEIAQALLKARLDAAAKTEGADRIFHEIPIRKSSGKASALSQAFTRARREVLGEETDGRLTFHSLRHTWMTTARRAGVPEGDMNDLGGWSGKRASSDAYDHGLLLRDLSERQEKVAERLKADGYLAAF